VDRCNVRNYPCIKYNPLTVSGIDNIVRTGKETRNALSVALLTNYIDIVTIICTGSLSGLSYARRGIVRMPKGKANIPSGGFPHYEAEHEYEKSRNPRIPPGQP